MDRNRRVGQAGRLEKMIDINKCPALDPEYEDPDGCAACKWETWQCRDAALAEVVRLRRVVEDMLDSERP